MASLALFKERLKGMASQARASQAELVNDSPATINRETLAAAAADYTTGLACRVGALPAGGSDCRGLHGLREPGQGGAVDVLLTVLAWLVLYRAAYRVARSYWAADVASRVVSVLNAAVLVGLAVWQLGWGVVDDAALQLQLDNEAPGPHAYGTWSWWAQTAPLGYLAHDALVLVLDPGMWDAATAAHHLVFACLVGYAAPYYPVYTAVAFLSELTVPLLYTAWGMHRARAHEARPRAFAGVTLALLAAFYFWRVRGFTDIFVEALYAGEPLVAVTMGTIAALNWYWFIALVHRALAALPRAAHEIALAHVVLNAVVRRTFDPRLVLEHINEPDTFVVEFTADHIYAAMFGVAAVRLAILYSSCYREPNGSWDLVFQNKFASALLYAAAAYSLAHTFRELALIGLTSLGLSLVGVRIGFTICASIGVSTIMRALSGDWSAASVVNLCSCPNMILAFATKYLNSFGGAVVGRYMATADFGITHILVINGIIVFLFGDWIDRVVRSL